MLCDVPFIESCYSISLHYFLAKCAGMFSLNLCNAFVILFLTTSD